jgi:uncharacterized protein YigE (DUF2233 family)
LIRRALVVASLVAAAGAVWIFGRGPRAGGPSARPAGAPLDAAPPAVDAVPVAPEVPVTAVAGDDDSSLLIFPLLVAGARFRVVDLGMTRDLDRVLRETGASLVVNGGFFDPSDRPEGLVMSEGAVLSARSDSLGGGILAVSEGRAALAPAEGFVAPPGTDFAVQARPRLVVHGRSNIARDDGRATERTALCLREDGRRLEVIVALGDVPGRGPTLAGLADLLARRGCEGALNLDGGPSTGVAWRQDGGVRAVPPRGPLRHAIVVWAAPGRR